MWSLCWCPTWAWLVYLIVIRHVSSRLTLVMNQFPSYPVTNYNEHSGLKKQTLILQLWCAEVRRESDWVSINQSCVLLGDARGECGFLPFPVIRSCMPSLDLDPLPSSKLAVTGSVSYISTYQFSLFPLAICLRSCLL